MNILIIGNGGREHALAWKIAQSEYAQRIFVASGNAGTATIPKVSNVDLSKPDEWIAFAREHNVGLTIVGPEAPLAQGVVDQFQAAGLAIFGPTQACTRLESSKTFAKDFMRRHGIPTADYRIFHDTASAHAYVNEQGAPIVIKADGLLAGKGVVVASTLEEAHTAIDHLWQISTETDKCLLIEECLAGEEASFIVMVDGKNSLPLATSQDHKRLYDGDTGPNTGGMGAYSPAPIVSPTLHAKILREIIKPTVHGMIQEGTPYTGFLYAGLMIDAQGQVKVLEFNCRLGDPEAQPLLMRLKTDLLTLIEHALTGRLDQIEARWDRRFALGVVMTTQNYPHAPRLHDAITDIPPDTADTVVFHAGTRIHDGQCLTNGGRVLCVTSLGDTLKCAQQSAYAVVNRIQFHGAHYRQDIGHRALSSPSHSTKG